MFERSYVMFIKELENKFGLNTPIFADEIVKCFCYFSRAYVFRLIKKAEMVGAIIPYSRGVYFIPKKTFFGKSTICSEMVAEKKYIRDGKEIYGVYAGVNLLNQFGITTQVPNILEIVTNKETTRKRSIMIAKKEFVIRKSRCEINIDNYSEYTILQLFNDMDSKEILDDFAMSQVEKYIKDNGVTRDKLLTMAVYFPSATVKKMIRSGILNGTF